MVVLTSGHEALDARVYGREASSLAELGFDIVVVGTWTRGSPGRVPVIPIPASRSRVTRFTLQPWRCLWAARHLRPDIVHFHDAELLAVLPLARLMWRRAKFVYDVHEDFGNLMMVRDWLPDAAKPAVRFLTDACERALSRFAHGIVAVTPPLAEKFAHRMKVVAFNFATERFFEQASRHVRPPAEREYDIVHVGTLNRRRAAFLAEVIRAYHSLKPGARSLVLGGDEKVVNEAFQSRPDGCEIRRKVPFDEIPAFLGNAKVGIDVHPWFAPHLAPALANKVCEYMACGCAVVASAMPVLDACIEGSGLEPRAIIRIRGGQPRDFAEAAVRLVQEVEAGRDPGASLRLFARKSMNWSTEAIKLARFYRELLGAKHA